MWRGALPTPEQGMRERAERRARLGLPSTPPSRPAFSGELLGRPEPRYPRSRLPERQISDMMLSRQMRIRPVFSTAQGIMDAYQGLSGDRRVVQDDVMSPRRFQTHQEFWEDKAKEAEQRGLPQQLQEGWDLDKPVSVRDFGFSNPKGETAHPEILGGHHRLAAMMRLGPTRLIPVQYFPTIGIAKRRLGERH